MTSNKSVIVLLPNGHRQNVKITSNTTILQVLEEACQKRDFNPDEYDLKHHNRVLDPNMIFRFAGLPNNALLETTNCTKPRSLMKVTIGIQLENGERLTGEFLPSVTLSEILNNVCPNENLETTVLIYMHQKIYGKKLEETTLKSLGITSGKAVLRLMHRSEEQLHTQAHVYIPPVRKPSVNADMCLDDEDSKENVSNSQSNVTSNEDKSMKPKDEIKDSHDSQVPQNMVLKDKIMDNKAMEEDLKSQTMQTEDSESNKMVIETEGQRTITLEEFRNQTISKAYSIIEKTPIKFLGERNALAFDQSLSTASPKDELPEDFYDLTVDDAKKLLKDAKRKREQIEDAPLLTSAQRQLDHDKRMLQQLHKYKKTIIRVQFPDRLVLQGIFGPLETIQDIKTFVKNHLDNPDSDFILYTVPPKTTLDSEGRLIDMKLVPSAIVYYSGPSTLKSEVRANLTDPAAADAQAVKSRYEMMREDQNIEDSIDERITPQVQNVAVPGPSSSSNYVSPSYQTSKAPKWFKKPFK